MPKKALNHQIAQLENEIEELGLMDNFHASKPVVGVAGVGGQQMHTTNNENRLTKRAKILLFNANNLEQWL